MKLQTRRLAPFGLYISLLAALVSVGLYIIQRQWNLPLQASLGFVIIGLALYGILNPEGVREGLMGRRARYGSNALIMLLAFVGILVVINYIVYVNPKRFDLTESQQHTLTQQTLDSLKALPQTVKAYAFFNSNQSSEQTRQLLDDYQYESNGKFEYEIVDAYSNPTLVREMNVTTSGTIVLQLGDKQEKASTASEQELTGALVRLMGEKASVYFLTGHDEYNLEESGDAGFSQMKTNLTQKGYTVNTLNLIATQKIPEDARTIVIAGPRRGLTSDEIKLLNDYQAKGGSLVVLLEPTALMDLGGSPDLLVQYLKDQWGIVAQDDFVIDPGMSNPLIAVSDTYTSHAITQRLAQLATVFPNSRSLSTTGGVSGVTSVDLVKTIPQAWGVTDIQGLVKSLNENQQIPAQDPAKDLAGPLTLAVAAQKTDNKGRIVVVGDAEFASNYLTSSSLPYGNSDLLINSVDWASQQENLISLTPKQDIQRLLVTPTNSQLNLILFGTVFLIPGSVVLIGVLVFVQRRRRG